MTELDLEPIKKRERNATEGQWAWNPFGGFPVQIVDNQGRDLARTVSHTSQIGGDQESRDNARFIAHARSDIPALVAEVERLREIEDAVRAVPSEHWRPAAFDKLMATLANNPGPGS